MATVSRLSVAGVSTFSSSFLAKSQLQSSSASFSLAKIPSAVVSKTVTSDQLRVTPVCVVSAELEGVNVADVPPAAEAGTKLYVGNLPFNVDSQSLAELFQESGVVEMVEVRQPNALMGLV